MVLEISSSVLNHVVTEAGETDWREVCGLLLGTPERITVALSCRNVAGDPTQAFEIDPSHLIAAHRMARGGGPQIVGCYHSHPAGPPVPSARDADAASPDGAIWMIVAGRDVGFYRAVERSLREGRFDALDYRIVDG